jgi:integrase
MRQESLQDPRRRARVQDNLYRRTTSDGRNVYECKFRDADGALRSRTLKARTEPAARREARALLARRDGGERVVGSAVRLRRFVDDDYLPLQDSLVTAGRRSERGVEMYRYQWQRNIEPRLGDLALGKIGSGDVSRLILDMREQGLAEGTIRNATVVLRAVFRLARSRGHVSQSPLDRLDETELPRQRARHDLRVLDERELQLVYAHARGPYRAVVCLLCFTGLRASEVLGLRWENVDLVEREIVVEGQLSVARRDRPARIVATKTASGVRVVPMFPAVEQALIELVKTELAVGRGNAGDFVFCTRKGTPQSQRNVAGRGVEAAARAAGLGHITPQDLRRSFCSLAARRGVDPVEAAKLTGHSLATWAAFYARSFGKAQRDEARSRMLESGFGQGVGDPVH